MRLHRYIRSELLKTTVAVIMILAVIGLSNTFVVQLAKAAAGELPAKIVLNLVVLSLPSMLGTLLPIGLFLGIILALGRLSADHELAVMEACGLGLAQLLKVALFPTILIALLSFYVHTILIPASLAKQEEVIAQAQSDWFSYMIAPGRFMRLGHSDAIFFAESIADHDKIQEVFIAEKPSAAEGLKKGHWGITASQQAYRWHDKQSNEDYLVLHDGHRYEGKPGDLDFRVVDFKRYGFRLDKQRIDVDYGINTTPTLQLLAQSSRLARAEVQWRMTLPLSIFVVAWLAIIMGRVSPRRGRYANVIPSAVVIICYSNFIILSKAWYIDASTPDWLGLWWVHGVAALVAMVLTGWRLRWWPRFKEWQHVNH